MGVIGQFNEVASHHRCLEIFSPFILENRGRASGKNGVRYPQLIDAIGMTDTLSKETRSWLMSRVRQRNTKPEIKIRSLLHQLGYRFRLHDKKLPGSPDIVLKKYKTVIFVHGCFWHRHPKCKKNRIPKSNVAFWKNKFAKNVKRDRAAQKALVKDGWKVFVVWECEIGEVSRLTSRIKKVLKVKRPQGGR
jgi:DNA mismatch endonuclease (patch repair protein)